MCVTPAFWLAFCLDVLEFILKFLLVLLAVTIHESAHVLVGLIFNTRVTKFIITPLGEAAELKGLDRKTPWERTAVIIAGPAINLLIGFLGLKIFNIDRIIPESGFGLAYFFAANIALGLFNMLPAFPLDGGRLWQLILGNSIGVARANRIICKISRITAILMIMAGLIQIIFFPYNMSLYLVGFFIFRNLPKEQLKLRFDFFSYFNQNRRVEQRIVPIKFFAVTPCMPVEELIDCLRWDTFSVFKIYFKNGDVARISENDLMSYVRDNGLNGRAGEVAFSGFHTGES